MESVIQRLANKSKGNQKSYSLSKDFFYRDVKLFLNHLLIRGGGVEIFIIFAPCRYVEKDHFKSWFLGIVLYQIHILHIENYTIDKCKYFIITSPFSIKAMDDVCPQAMDMPTLDPETKHKTTFYTILTNDKLYKTLVQDDKLLTLKSDMIKTIKT